MMMMKTVSKEKRPRNQGTNTYQALFRKCAAGVGSRPSTVKTYQWLEAVGLVS